MKMHSIAFNHGKEEDCEGGSTSLVHIVGGKVHPIWTQNFKPPLFRVSVIKKKKVGSSVKRYVGYAMFNAFLHGLFCKMII